jgi:hypothetical protein
MTRPVNGSSWSGPAPGAHPLVTPAFTQPGLLSRRPGIREPGDGPAEAPRLDAGEDTLAQGRAAQVLRHNNTQAARPPSCPGSAVIVMVHHVDSAAEAPASVALSQINLIVTGGFANTAASRR